MGPDGVWRRIRWGNVARLGALVALALVVAAWPRLRGAPPRLPGTTDVPVGGAPKLPGARKEAPRVPVRGGAGAKRGARAKGARAKGARAVREPRARAKGKAGAKPRARAKPHADAKPPLRAKPPADAKPQADAKPAPHVKPPPPRKRRPPPTDPAAAEFGLP